MGHVVARAAVTSTTPTGHHAYWLLKLQNTVLRQTCPAAARSTKSKKIDRRREATRVVTEVWEALLAEHAVVNDLGVYLVVPSL